MIARTPYLVSLLLFMCISWHFIPVAGSKIRHLLLLVSGVLNLQQDLYSDDSNSVGQHGNAGNNLLLSDDTIEDKLSLDKTELFHYNSYNSYTSQRLANKHELKKNEELRANKSNWTNLVTLKKLPATSPFTCISHKVMDDSIYSECLLRIDNFDMPIQL